LRILDLTAGNRGIWFDKEHRDTLYLDIRPGVRPDLVADCRRPLPAGPERYDLVVFDPPHLNFGAKSNMSKTYGHHTTQEILDLVENAAYQAWKVTRPDALMALKWNDHSISLKRVLALMPHWEPLFGHGVSESQRRNKATSWVMLRRREEMKQ
jgi:hypothetical protein